MTNEQIKNKKGEMIVLQLNFNDAPKTYASKANAKKAIEKFVAEMTLNNRSGVHHCMIVQNDFGRYVPVFIGERAVQAGLHFHFCVAG